MVVIPERGSFLLVRIEVGRAIFLARTSPRDIRRSPAGSWRRGHGPRRALRAYPPPRRAGCGRSAGNAWQAVHSAIRSGAPWPLRVSNVGPGDDGAVAPQARRRKIAVQFALHLPHGYPEVGNLRGDAGRSHAGWLGDLGNWAAHRRIWREYPDSARGPRLHRDSLMR